MNRIEVQEMIEKDVKVRHVSFDSQGWIKKHPKSKEHYIDERKNVISVSAFWKWRTGPRWNKDWSITKKQ